MPKTGGGAMEHFFREQFARIRRNYFLSFNGNDDSRIYDDALRTRRSNGNRCVAEFLAQDPALRRKLARSPHFLQAQIVFGHQTTLLGALFPDFRWRYISVLRDPVERAISNLVQFSSPHTGSRLGSEIFDAPRCSPEYWEQVRRILARGLPVPGLLVHENYYISNAMTHVLAGNAYRHHGRRPDIFVALAMAFQMQLALYENFNAGLQRCFDALGVPIVMAENTRADEASPRSAARAALGRHYGAPPDVIALVAQLNAVDIQLYDILAPRIRDADAAYRASHNSV